MAQEQNGYETIFGEQAEVLRADLPKSEGAMAQITPRCETWSTLGTRARYRRGVSSSCALVARCDNICRFSSTVAGLEELSFGKLLRFQFTI